MSVKCQIFYDGRFQDIEIEPIGAGFWLEKNAALAFNAMRQAAQIDGLALVVNTALRTHEHQKRLYDEYVVEMAAWKTGKTSKRPNPVAVPGSRHSHHEQGTAVDLNRAQGDDLSTPEPDSPTDKWLVKNAKRFAFFNTVAVEPWHWQHVPELVGIDHNA